MSAPCPPESCSDAIDSTICLSQFDGRSPSHIAPDSSKGVENECLSIRVKLVRF